MSVFLRFNGQNEVILASSECAKKYCEYKKDQVMHRVSSPEEVQKSQGYIKRSEYSVY